MLDYENKFYFKELFLNDNNKTSGSAFTGVILGIVVSISWVSGIVGMYMDLDLEMLQMFFKYTLALGGTSALLLGARKIVGAITAKK